jgi:PBSX family phage terminase large subunit
VEGSKSWFNCNPGHPSHWFYNEWIKKSGSKNALYLHFTMSENPSLSPEMLERYEGLYEGTFYERYVLGRWVAGEGLVYPMFNEGCISEPVAPCTAYFISCDYGTVNPSSFGLWGVSQGRYYRIAEYYFDSRKEGVQRTDEEHYKGLCELAGDRHITAVICDPSAASFMACIRKHGRFRPSPAINDVTDGIRRVCDALKSGRIKISPNCKASIKEFSLYRWDESAKRDAPRKENDHAMDDIRYFVSTALRETRQGAIALAAKR